MIKGLPILFALCLFLYYAKASESDTYPSGKALNSENMRILSSSIDRVPINCDGSSCYLINVSFIKNSSSYAGSALIGLYTSHSYIYDGCISRDTPNLCDKVDCEYEYLYMLPFSFLWGDYVTSNISLKSSDGIIQATSWAPQGMTIVTKACVQMTIPYGNWEAAGIVGMGFGSGSNSERTVQTFSIYLNATNNSGHYLLFKEDLSFAYSSEPRVKLAVDEELQIKGVTAMQIGNTSIKGSANITFDINTNYIMLPRSFFDPILASIGYCSYDYQYSPPSCSFTGNLTGLPNISITVGNQRIDIPPQLYINEYTNSNFSSKSFDLNIVPIDGYQGTHPYAVNPYLNTIVLGSSFMTYYYTVFSSNPSNTVTLYLANNPSLFPQSPPSHFIRLFIFIVALIVVVIFAQYVRVRNERRDNQRKALRSYNTESSHRL